MKNGIDLSSMIERWSSPIVAREELSAFTGGAITPKYQANIDSSGEGPDSFLIGRKRCYFTKIYVPWLEGRISGVRRRAL